MKNHDTYARKALYGFTCTFSLLVCFCTGCSENIDEALPDNRLADAEEILTRGSFETDAFITEWYVPKDSLVRLPLDTAYFYNFIVDWGDDSNLQQFTNQNLLSAKHRYNRTGTYRVRILGTCETWNWIGHNTSQKFLTKVVQWGNVNFKSLDGSFMDCINLISIPAGIPNVENYKATFIRCTGLTSLPDGLFAGCYKAKYFANTFSGCTNLRTIPKKLFADCWAMEDFKGTFSNTGLFVIPEGIFKNCHNVKRFFLTFTNCRQLKEIPEDLFADCENAEMFLSTFSGCTELSSIPRGLFDNCKNARSFGNVFLNCTALTGYTPNTNGIELWERTSPDYPESIQGSGCFKGCTNLANYAAIPASWK